jgi:glutamyl-tRNA synthetase
MSLTLDPSKAKISKRKHGELVAVHYYREHGFLPWAFVNFLSLLGWSTADSKQIFSREELIEAFSLEGINRANSIFDIRTGDGKFTTDPKALSVNAHYIRTMPLEELEPYVKAELDKEGLWDLEFEGTNRGRFLQTVDLLRARFRLTTDFATLGRAYFSDDFEMDPAALQKNVLKHEGLKQWLPMAAGRLESLEVFSVEEAERGIREMAEELEIKPGVLINAIRTVVTGQAVGPGLFEALLAVGKRRVVDRLRRADALFT